MRFLFDANLSPTSVELVRTAGFESVHVQDVELLRASDEVICAYAVEHGWVVVTADADFPALLALSGATSPSVVHLRGVAKLNCGARIALLLANLNAVAPALEAGAIVSLSPTRLAVRSLPIR